MNTRTFTLLAVALLALAAISCRGVAQKLMEQGDPNGAKVGDRAPDFVLPTASGGEASLIDYLGRPVVLYFWASWCGSCTYDIPAFDKVADRLAGDGPAIITVNVGEEPEFVEQYVLDRVGSDYRFVVASDVSLDTFRRYRILSFPTTFFVGEDGYIKDMRVGRVDEDYLNEEIIQLETLALTTGIEGGPRTVLAHGQGGR